MYNIYLDFVQILCVNEHFHLRIILFIKHANADDLARLSLKVLLLD